MGSEMCIRDRLYGGRDHSTVLYSIRKVASRMDGDEAFRHRVEEVMAELKSDHDRVFHG